MGRKFQIKRGAKATMPTLAHGEFGLTTDAGAEELYIGNGSKNIEIARKDDVYHTGNKPTAADLGVVSLRVGVKMLDVVNDKSGISGQGSCMWRTTTSTWGGILPKNHAFYARFMSWMYGSYDLWLGCADNTGIYFTRTIDGALPTSASEWKKLATTDAALMRDGSNAMTGVLSFNSKANINQSGGSLYVSAHNVGDSENRRMIRIGSPAEVPNFNDSLLFYDVTNGASKPYNILHTGNKNLITAADVGAVPTTRKVNGKALSEDIALTAADVGAVAGSIIKTTGSIKDVTQSGKYTIGPEVSDMPYSGAWWIADVGYSNGNCEITVKNLFSSSHVYTQSMSNGVWNGWEQLATTADLDALTAADVGAVAWGNNVLESGSIKDWIASQTRSTSIAVGSDVTDMPYASYWHVDLKVGAGSTWKYAVARLAGGRDVQEIQCVNGTWETWCKIATTDTALMRDGSNAMTGPLWLNDWGSGTHRTMLTTHDNHTHLRHEVDGNNQVSLLMSMEEEASLAVMRNGVYHNYPILHTGNVVASATDITAGSSASWQQYLVYE